MRCDVRAGARQHDLAVTPDARAAVGAVSATTSEERTKLCATHGRRRVNDLEEPATRRAPCGGFQITRLAPATRAALAAGGPHLHRRHCSTSTRAPTRSTSHTRTRLSIA